MFFVEILELRLINQSKKLKLAVKLVIDDLLI